ncbi:ROK family protein [Streptomyces sp. NBC_01017]|uniref:ROK family protein n=1 Tax=Streptomyces sp. NBC_01017 TaxID=2903721 RepID=UPI0038633509
MNRSKGGTGTGTGSGVGLGGVNLGALRSHNTALVLDLLRTAGAEGISRLELAERTGLTPQAVSKITARLREDGLAAEAGRRASTGGKPRTVLRLVPEAGHAVGVHLDRDELTAVLCDLTGAVIAQRRTPLDLGAGAETVVERAVREVEELVAGGGRPGAVLGVGVALPGPLDHRRGVLHRVTGFPEWNGFPLRDVLARRLALPVVVDKDTNAAALGLAVGGAVGSAGGSAGGGSVGGGMASGTAAPTIAGSGTSVSGGAASGTTDSGTAASGAAAPTIAGSGTSTSGATAPVTAAPVTSTSGAAAPVTSTSGAAAPVTSTSGAAAPITPTSGTTAPVTAASGTTAPVTAASGTTAPVTAATGTTPPVSAATGTTPPIPSAASFAYLHFGAGLGGGLVIGGAVHRGTRTGAGEFGHQVVQLDGPPCGCGNRGCVEALCLAAVARGDLAEAARVLGTAAGNLVALLDVDLVLLGGRTVAAAPETFVRGVAAVLDERARRAGEDAVPVRVAAGGERGVAEGAAQLLLAPLFGRAEG